MHDNVGVRESVSAQVGRGRAIEEKMQVVGEWHVVARHADGTIFADETVHNLLTTGGRAFIHDQVYRNTSAGTQGSRFIAVTVDTGAPAAGDTVLTGEITTGGLGRAAATTNTYSSPTTTLAVTFTATATHTAVQKMALFNASSAGTMTHEATITPVTLNSTDTLTITANLTAQ